MTRHSPGLIGPRNAVVLGPPGLHLDMMKGPAPYGCGGCLLGNRSLQKVELQTQAVRLLRNDLRSPCDGQELDEGTQEVVRNIAAG